MHVFIETEYVAQCCKRQAKILKLKFFVILQYIFPQAKL